MKKFICIALALTCTFSCKKDTLSKELEPIKDLFADDSKWYLDRYEVDGIDSTEHAFPGNANDNEVGALTFSAKKAKDYPSPIVKNKSFEALFTYYPSSSSLNFTNGMAYCDCVANPQCNKNIFMLWCAGSYWDVSSITANEMIITCQKDNNANKNIKKSYRLVLTKIKNEIISH